MFADARKLFALVSAVRERTTDLSPTGLGSRLSGKFECLGEWVLKNAQVGGVTFEFWLRSHGSSVAAHFLLSDVRFNFEDCYSAITEIYGPAEFVHSKRGFSGWITYDESDLLRSVTFIFDGGEDELYLEMIVVGHPAAAAK